MSTYFGGKSRIADEVWARIGDVDNAIEPFCGSLAWLLARPHAPKVECANDLNCYVANFWRAVSCDPEAVAGFADYPVSEIDMHARHRWLVRSKEAAEFRERMRSDPDYFDPKIAGWWAWGACCWIGSGWCGHPEWEGRVSAFAGDGEYGIGHGVNKLKSDGALPKKIPVLCSGSTGGRGIHQDSLETGSVIWQQRPQLEDSGGRGVLGSSEWQQLSRMSCDNGLQRQGRPQLADAFSRGRGVNGNDRAETCRDRREWLLDWFKRLQDRLRAVRVCCGHWKRVCDSDSVTTRLGVSGVFLDPPYPTHNAEGAESRDGTIYATDGDRDELDKLRDEVLEYCRERGSDPRMRICVAGYDTDGYAALEALGWTVLAWKANGGYANRGGGEENENRGRERIWFSPHCVDVESQRRPLFAGME